MLKPSYRGFFYAIILYLYKNNQMRKSDKLKNIESLNKNLLGEDYDYPRGHEFGDGSSPLPNDQDATKAIEQLRRNIGDSNLLRLYNLGVKSSGENWSNR